MQSLLSNVQKYGKIKVITKYKEDIVKSGFITKYNIKKNINE